MVASRPEGTEPQPLSSPCISPVVHSSSIQPFAHGVARNTLRGPRLASLSWFQNLGNTAKEDVVLGIGRQAVAGSAASPSLRAPQEGAGRDGLVGVRPVASGEGPKERANEKAPWLMAIDLSWARRSSRTVQATSMRAAFCLCHALCCASPVTVCVGNLAVLKPVQSFRRVAAWKGRRACQRAQMVIKTSRAWLVGWSLLA